MSIKIEKLVFGGQGLGRDGGKVYFVWNALPGEVVDLKITKEKKNFVEAVATKIIEPSADRTQPADAHYLNCSPWQILSWEKENFWKAEIAKEVFHKNGGFDVENLEIIYDEHEYNYRNKVEYRVVGEKGSLELAFYERDSNNLTPVEPCELVRNEINDRALEIVEFLNEKKYAAKDVSKIVIKCDQKGKTLAAAVIQSKFVRFDKHEYLEDEILGVRLRYGINSFFQINVPVFAKAVEEISKFLDKDKQIVDFYAGVGAISLPLAKFFKRGMLVEENKEAISSAGDNIAINKLANCETKLASSEKAVELIEKNKIIILDPPREGLDASVVKMILDIKPERVIYLSCDVATQARDIKLLSDFYKINTLKLFNFFPKTPHIESLAVLDLK